MTTQVRTILDYSVNGQILMDFLEDTFGYENGNPLFKYEVWLCREIVLSWKEQIQSSNSPPRSRTNASFLIDIRCWKPRGLLRGLRVEGNL